MQDFSADDLYLHQKLMTTHCSARGSSAVAAVRSVDRENDGYVSRLWLFPLDGGEPRQLTSGSAQDESPRISDDGRCVVFVSDRTGDTAQLYLIDVDGGEARSCGSLAGGVGSPRWAPDGKSVLVAGTVKVDPDQRGQRSSSPAESWSGSPELAWRLPYKADGIGYVLGREVHLFRVCTETGVHSQLTDGPFDVMGFEPSLDGRVAYVRTREGRFAHRTDLWTCDADGGNARQLTDSLATVMQPAWSPDGRWLAFPGAEREGDGRSRLYLYDFEHDALTAAGDETVEVAAIGNAVQWSVDGRQVVFVQAYRGAHRVAAVDVKASGSVRVLLAGDRQLGAFAYGAAHLVYSVEQPTSPSELFASGIDGGDERQLSDLNAWWNERPPLKVERRDFEVPDGSGGKEAIEGWLIRCADAPSPQPLLNDVHGGPGAYALLDFDTNVFWQVLCAKGWAVLALNAVGSSSYGKEFCDRLTGHWGELDLPQHLEAVRQLQDEGVTDGRIAVSGKSYGGYLSAWTVGTTSQFKAAVVMAPVGNIETHYGTSDGGYYADPLYLDTAPAFDRSLARKLSPLQRIENATTPTLFLQGKDDERCPKCQSEELFVSLCRAGDTATELVLYPGEDHHFLGEGSPRCRADAAQRIVNWVTGHADPGGVLASAVKVRTGL